MPKKNITKRSKFQTFLAQYWHIVLPIGVVFLAGLWLVWLYRHQINPDAVSYITIARDYANLHFKEAVNGYWSPLLSWLLTPFIWLGIDPQFAFRILNLGVALLTTVTIACYNYRNSKLPLTTQAALTACVGFTTILWSSQVITPDLLSGLIALLVTLSALRTKKKPDIKNGVLLGITLCLLYFAKSIGFYIALLLLVGLAVYAVRERAHQFISALRVSAAVFVVFSGLWITVISLKYDHLTVSTAGSFNFALIGPSAPKAPSIVHGYAPPHYADDITAWDDPSYIKIKHWSPLHSWKNFSYYLQHIYMSILLSLSYLLKLSPLILIALAAIWLNIRQGRRRFDIYLILSISAITVVAYSLVVVDQRYLWLPAVPLLLLVSLFDRKQRQVLEFLTPLLLVCLTVSAVIVLQAANSRPIEESSDGALKAVSVATKRYTIPHQRVAVDATAQDYAICYYMDVSCQGAFTFSPSNILGDESTLASLRKHDIKYYLAPNDSVEETRRDLPVLQKSLRVISHTQDEKVCFEHQSCGAELYLYKITDD